MPDNEARIAPQLVATDSIMAVTVTDREGEEPVVELIELVDLEIYARRGEKPPRAKSYRIKIDKAYFTVHVDHMTGSELLTLAGKLPPEKFMITEKVPGNQPRRIQLTETVYFHTHCIERFMTMPLDPTEG